MITFNHRSDGLAADKASTRRIGLDAVLDAISPPQPLLIGDFESLT